MSAAAFNSDSIQPFLHRGAGQLRMETFIRGVRCGHCVQKIEKVLEGADTIDHFQFNSGGERLTIWSREGLGLSRVLNRINDLGFEVIPLLESDDQQAAREDYKKSLKEIAVAAVCAGNIMLFSTAVYLGADPTFTGFFHKLSLALIMPVLFYSARSIWRGFFSGIKTFRFNLDLPIGLALITGTLLSLWSLLTGADSVYFDSVAVVVFLILTSRFFLKGFVSRIYEKNIIHYVPGVYQVRKLEGDKESIVAIDQVKAGETVLVRKGETLPVDGRLLSEDALIDLAVISGESAPVKIKQYDRVFAGSRLCLGEIKIETSQSGVETRVGQMIKASQEQVKTNQEESFRWVANFTGFVVLASFVTLAVNWYLSGFAIAFERAFAIIIVACPCAISFGVPLIRFFTGQAGIKSGFIVKNPLSLKRLRKIKDVFLDKTGTLTEDHFKIDSADFAQFTKQDQQKILSLELQMDHPISRGFNQFMPIEVLPVEDFKYNPGVGLSGIIRGEAWRVETDLSASKDKRLAIYKDNHCIGTIAVSTTHKDGLSKAFQLLADRKVKVHVLSGDSFEQIEPIKKMVPENAQGQFFGRLKPEEKQKIVDEIRRPALMVGDGLNDIAAMQKASLSLCMPGALENNLAVADISLTRGDLGSLQRIYELASTVEKTETELFTFTVIYNLFCIGLAATGYITPVMAAILMPTSSIIVLTLVSLSFRRQLWK